MTFREPKTERSRRRMDLPARAHQAEERLRVAATGGDYDLICCDPLGRRLSSRRVTKAFSALCQNHNLAVSLHGLHHGFASMLLASEVHPRVVQTALGHNSIQVTIDTYSHLLPDMGRDAATKNRQRDQNAPGTRRWRPKLVGIASA